MTLDDPEQYLTDNSDEKSLIWWQCHMVCQRLVDSAGFNVSTNTVYVIWETVLQVKRPNQQYQSTEGTHRLHK